MKVVICRSALQADPKLMSVFLSVVKQDSAFMRASYPQFDEWIKRKVLPGILEGERTVVIEHRDMSPVGLLIVKHTAMERKLCTLRVRANHESRGMGVRLFETAFELLGTSRPLLSVSAPTMPKFERLFDHFGFSREAVYHGIYLPKVQELSFNGLLEAPVSPPGSKLTLAFA